MPAAQSSVYSTNFKTKIDDMHKEVTICHLQAFFTFHINKNKIRCK